MKFVRLFMKDSLCAPAVLALLLPLSFFWTSETEITWLFWPNLAVPATLLIVGGSACTMIAAWRTKQSLSASAD